MKCSQIRKMFSPYMDNELAPDELKLFTSHIQECPACKEELEETQNMHQLFACAERFEAPFGFATRVMAHLEEIEEAGLFSRLWRLLTSRPLFLRTVEVAFALVIMLIGVMSGNMLVGDRMSGNVTSETQAAVRETFSLDLLQATPRDSIGGVYATLVEGADEK